MTDVPTEQLFTAKVVRAVCGISDRQLTHWVSRDIVRPAKSYRKTGVAKRPTHLFDYEALVQIRLARGLRDAGVPLQKIVSAVKKLRARGREQWQREWLLVAGNGEIVWSANGTLEQVSGKCAGQLVFSAIVLPALAKKVRDDLAAHIPFEKPASGEIISYGSRSNERKRIA